MASKVCAVVGGQWGSEGKGNIVNHLANEFDVHVRTGSPNAGHSFKYPVEMHLDAEGTPGHCHTFKMQVVPCGWTNPNAWLVIGRGAIFNPEILSREIAEIELIAGMDITDRLIIDPLAGVLHPEYAEEEGHTKGELHKRIGSTGEGVGVARRRRMERCPEQFQLAKDYDGPECGLVQSLLEEGGHVDTVGFLDCMVRVEDKNILLEGTQGSGLSLIHGSWPFVTTTDTNAAQLLADCGLAPSVLTHCVLVVRRYPIRVAGNSGPMGVEIDWETVQDRAGYVDGEFQAERTTVTKKVRRVAEWDPGVVRQAVQLNRPTCIAFNFADHITREVEGQTNWDNFPAPVRSFVNRIETNCGVPITFIGTGGPKWSIADRRISFFPRTL